MNYLKKVRVSIVIPVYNEAAHLGACLQAIADQTALPDEVIVVDNNSTDASRQVARSFPFVRLISEPKQGVVHARAAGFDAARGDVIGRIDADSKIADNWVESVRRIFQNDDVAAVSGAVYYYDVTSPQLSAEFDLFFRRRLARQLDNEVFLYGANMALRRSSWLQVRNSLCQVGGLHEDFDLAIHLEDIGQKVIFQANLLAGVSLRRFEGGMIHFWQYARLSPLTYARHGRRSQRHMYIIIAVVLSTYWFIWLNHRAYDPSNERISWRRLISANNHVRVNPATYVE